MGARVSSKRKQAARLRGKVQRAATLQRRAEASAEQAQSELAQFKREMMRWQVKEVSVKRLVLPSVLPSLQDFSLRELDLAAAQLVEAVIKNGMVVVEAQYDHPSGGQLVTYSLHIATPQDPRNAGRRPEFMRRGEL